MEGSAFRIKYKLEKKNNLCVKDRDVKWKKKKIVSLTANIDEFHYAQGSSQIMSTSFIICLYRYDKSSVLVPLLLMQGKKITHLFLGMVILFCVLVIVTELFLTT